MLNQDIVLLKNQTLLRISKLGTLNCNNIKTEYKQRDAIIS